MSDEMRKGVSFQFLRKSLENKIAGVLCDLFGNIRNGFILLG